MNHKKNNFFFYISLIFMKEIEKSYKFKLLNQKKFKKKAKLILFDYFITSFVTKTSNLFSDLLH